MNAAYRFDGEQLMALPTPAVRPLRWAAWRMDGSLALLVGNRGEALAYDGAEFERLATKSAHNLRGAAWSPDGERALLCGNRGAVLLYDGRAFDELVSPTTENLRRVAWHPGGAYALIIGNAGIVLRFDAATGALEPLPGDRAHTLRSIAFRRDGAYALVGAYASRYAGYPRPHSLYLCDGRYLQAMLTTDDEDDALAIDWRPGSAPPAALVLVASYRSGEIAANKLVEYDGAGMRTTAIEAPATLLGAGWSPDGSYALLCGERGTLMRTDGASMTALTPGTRDTLVGPFWRPRGEPMALLLKGPDEKVYTV